jgi:diaminopimelate epimerase
LRYDPQFAPSGVNVNFAQALPGGRIQMRTYERGVEGETLSCGTGAMAVACVASRLYSLPSPIQIETRGDPLFPHQIDCSEEGIALCSRAQIVFQGLFQPSLGSSSCLRS